MIIKLANDFDDIGAKLYKVGGIVRDSIMGRTSKDIDLVVTNTNDTQIVGILNKNNIIAKKCGNSFSVYKFTFDSIEYDLALARTERSTGQLHTDFDINTNNVTIEQDLERRDFTINAIAYDILNDKYIDKFNGIEDIKNGIIRHITDTSISDDFLRALRSIQFASRFNFNIHPDTFNMIKTNINLINTISPERIQIELNKLLLSDNLILGFHYLKHTGLLSSILPDLDQLDNNKYNVLYHYQNAYLHTLESLQSSVKHNNLILQLTLMLHDIGKNSTCTKDNNGIYHNHGHEVVSAELAEQWLIDMKYDNYTIDIVYKLIRNHIQAKWTIKIVRRLISLYRYDFVYLLLDVVYYDRLSHITPMSMNEYYRCKDLITQLAEQETRLTAKSLAINGFDIMGYGLGGKLIGQCLKYLLNIVLDKPELNNIESLLELTKNFKNNINNIKKD